MSQATLAIQLNKSVNYITAIENKASFPPPETIDQIAQILGVRPAQLFDEDGSPENVRANSRSHFAEEVSAELERRLSQIIRREVQEVLG